MCHAITDAFARQISTEVRSLLIEDATYCDTTVLGPACDRPGLEHLAGVLATFPDGVEGAFNAWRNDAGGIVLHDNEPRPNQTD